MLLGFLFLQSVIAAHIPKSDKSPLLSSFLVGSLVLSGFNVVAVSLIGEVYNAGEKTGPLKNSKLRLLERYVVAHILRAFTFCTPASCVKLNTSLRRRRRRRLRSRRPQCSVGFSQRDIDLNRSDREDTCRSSNETDHKPLEPPNSPLGDPEPDTLKEFTERPENAAREDERERLQQPDVKLAASSRLTEEGLLSEPEIKSVKISELNVGMPFRGHRQQSAEDHSGEDMNMNMQINTSNKPHRIIQLSNDKLAKDPSVAFFGQKHTEDPSTSRNSLASEKLDIEDQQHDACEGGGQPKHKEICNAVFKAKAKESERVWHYFALLLGRLHCIVYIVAQLLLVVVYLHPIWHKRGAPILESKI